MVTPPLSIWGMVHYWFIHIMIYWKIPWKKWRKSADLVGFYEDLMAHFIGIEWDYNQKS